ncbi:MAG TPA: hypothetical protein VF252_01580 [Gemmatimonadales bacterium]
MSYWAMLAGALAVAGCSGGGDRARRPADSAGMASHMDSGRMTGMPLQGMPMMSGMRALMDSMAGLSPQQMQTMMPRHQEVMSQMLDRMGADMRGMNMPGSPEWTALADSVKRDLAELPGLSGQQLPARMRAHTDRVRRLITSHEQMMKAMH